MIPGSSNSIIAENTRTLRSQGYSESDAVARAHKFAAGSDDETDETGVDSPDESEAVEPRSDRQFVIVTKDFSGLGWAKKLQEEGETVTLAHKCEEDDPKVRKQYEKVGEGWLTTMTLDQAIGDLQTANTYWIFAENNFPKEADRLRKKGQKVFGTSAFTDRLEHDRSYAVSIADEAGLSSPATHEFKSLDEGMAFLDENPDTAYVFKPDDGKFNYTTFVPVRKADKDANREAYTYMQHMVEDPGSFILQERIPLEDALEVNAEVWIFEGEPFLATVGLECKRKNTYDIGEMCGCAGDFMMFVPLDTPLIQQTIGKLLPFYKEQNYTGFADVNVIFTKDGKSHFLEVCNRFGYNSHVTMFLALALDGFGNLIADFVDGHVDGMADRFRTDIGCSMTVFLDHPREGLPVHLDPSTAEQFYPFDGYKEDDDTLLLTGYSDEVGIFVDHAATVEAAAKKVWGLVVDKEAISFPDIYFRDDLGGTDYPNAPVRRYRELCKRGLL